MTSVDRSATARMREPIIAPAEPAAAAAQPSGVLEAR
jgi:hypothetical protein